MGLKIIVRDFVSFFCRVTKIIARILASLNIMAIVAGVMYFIPVSCSRKNVFVEIERSKGVNDALDFLYRIDYNEAIYISICFF